MVHYTIKWLEPHEDRTACCALRKEVFVDEQQFEEEFDATDEIAWHLQIMDGSVTIATARLFFNAYGQATVGRICVKKQFRGKEIGRLVLELSERKAAQANAKELFLGAQSRAKGFYEKCGYTVCGQPYFEEYCEHITMSKLLHLHCYSSFSSSSRNS